MKKDRFAELDALRGLAAMAVVVFHFTNHARNNGVPVFDFDVGQYGVQLFFCVSGFVIYWTLQRSVTLTDFAVSRFSRLYPSYWAAIALLLVLDFAFGRAPWLGGYVTNVTMLQHFIGRQDIDVVYWTLAVELMFYAWMALFFWLGWLRHVTLIAMAWLAVSIAAGVIGRFRPIGEPLQTLLMAEHVPYFAAGLMFYLVRSNGWNAQRIGVIGLACIAAGANAGWIGVPVAGVVFAVFSLAVSGKLKWVVNSTTVWLGAISYALYLTHRALGGVVSDTLVEAGTPRYVAFAAAVLAAIGLASLLTLAVERPALAAVRNWYSRRKASATPLSPAKSY